MLALVLFPIVAGTVQKICAGARAAERESSEDWAEAQVLGELIANNPHAAAQAQAYVVPAPGLIRRGNMLLTPNEAWVIDNADTKSLEFKKAMAAAMARQR